MIPRFYIKETKKILSSNSNPFAYHPTTVVLCLHIVKVFANFIKYHIGELGLFLSVDATVGDYRAEGAVTG